MSSAKWLPPVCKNWIPLAVTITLLSGLVFVTVQQVLRQGANDPQIQIAEDVAMGLSQGMNAQMAVPQSRAPIDISKTLLPFVIIYSDAGIPLISSAQLSGKTPIIPAGVLDNVRKTGMESRLTWQPQPDVRIAAVITRFQGTTSGFVVVGRSLREAEVRVSQLTSEVFLGWAGALFVSWFTGLLFRKP